MSARTGVSVCLICGGLQTPSCWPKPMGMSVPTDASVCADRHVCLCRPGGALPADHHHLWVPGAVQRIPVIRGAPRELGLRGAAVGQGRGGSHLLVVCPSAVGPGRGVSFCLVVCPSACDPPASWLAANRQSVCSSVRRSITQTLVPFFAFEPAALPLAGSMAAVSQSVRLPVTLLPSWLAAGRQSVCWSVRLPATLLPSLSLANRQSVCLSVSGSRPLCSPKDYEGSLHSRPLSVFAPVSYRQTAR
jgi:hypothetical protein